MTALDVLEARIVRLEPVGRSVREATFEFHALCEGLAAMELRGLMPGLDVERLWRDGLRALVAGLASD